MNKGLKLFLCLGLLFSLTGCQNAKTRAPEGAVIGGLLGAAAGGIIGHQSHSGAEGAAIGAAAGAITGAIVGAQINKPQPAQTTPSGQIAQANNPNQMPIDQVINLSKQGAHESVIIDKIRLSNSKYTLSATDIDNLKKQGVSQKVIDEMQKP
ncbi:MAG: YMGG-like glycine zipper-containing protein [Candidatus Omnitrophica bacterium]|nr:YMGG-like glycine zipper-containing protein [Candidatus Omnitrophota bacterium]